MDSRVKHENDSRVNGFLLTTYRNDTWVEMDSRIESENDRVNGFLLTTYRNDTWVEMDPRIKSEDDSVEGMTF